MAFVGVCPSAAHRAAVQQLSYLPAAGMSAATANATASYNRSCIMFVYQAPLLKKPLCAGHPYH
jgi:hypothetical protein